MCSPSRATLFTGRYPAEHGVTLTLTAARPAARPAQHARRSPRRWPTSCAAAQAPRAAACSSSSRRGALRLGPKHRRRAGAAGRDAEPGDAAARARGYRSPTRASGTSPIRRAARAAARRLERRATPSGSSATTASPTGRRPTRARTRRPSTSAAATPATGEGWDEVYTRQAERWLAPRRAARALLPRRLARQPARRARLPGLVRARRLRAPTSSATSASSCRRPSTRTSRPSRPCTR